MTQGTDPSGGPAQPGSLNPYERLGITPDASFDAVQAAKQARLAEVGEEPMARARIEAARRDQPRNVGVRCAPDRWAAESYLWQDMA